MPLPTWANRIFQKLGVKTVINGGNWVAGDAPGNRYSNWASRSFPLVGTAVNWDGITGDLFQNPAAASCYKWIWQNYCQATPQVKQYNSKGEEEIFTEHPLLELLQAPSPTYDYSRLMGIVIHDVLVDGNAYLGINRESVLPSELIRIDPNRIKPHKSSDAITVPFDQWEYRDPKGQLRYVLVSEVVHIAMGVDPNDQRLGFAPYKALKRAQYTLDQASNYSASIMRNMGVTGGIISPKEPHTTFEPEEIVKVWNSKTRGDRVGEVMALDMPIDIQFPQNNPQKMALDTIQDRPESDICAVFGVPAQVVGLHSGRLSKTYANMKEAREIAWEETIIPLLGLIGLAITKQLLSQFVGRGAGVRQELCFDIRQIRPLQPDLDALHARTRADWQANLITRADWKRATGSEPLPEDEGVYYCDVVGSNVIDIPADTPTKTTRKPERKGAALERYNGDRIFEEMLLLEADDDPEGV